jgi:hypothetical protein
LPSNGPDYTRLVIWIATCGTWDQYWANQAYTCWTGAGKGDYSACYIPKSGTSSSAAVVGGGASSTVQGQASTPTTASAVVGTGTSTGTATAPAAVATTSRSVMGETMRERAASAMGISMGGLFMLGMAAILGFGLL